LANKIGVYTFELRATLKDFSEMDDFLEIKSTFELTITSVCEDETPTWPIINDMSLLLGPGSATAIE
jgi:hypothetical protein